MFKTIMTIAVLFIFLSGCTLKQPLTYLSFSMTHPIFNVSPHGLQVALNPDNQDRSTNHFTTSVLDNSAKVKEMNFVFLHGMGASPCSLQLLSDYIARLAPVYISTYRQNNRDIDIHVNTLMRCYPRYDGIEDWARNITTSIDEHFGDKDNLILVGHSMGGKAALYAVAENVDNFADKVDLVVTINSPIRSLQQYYPPGGGPVAEYCRTVLLGSDEGVCDSVTRYDSTDDGAKVGSAKNWLAFVSGETAPLSGLYDRAGVDAWPRNIDDGVVPLSAQFSDGADVIYYGKHGHSDFGISDEPARLIANQMLRYIFGYAVECSVFARGGELEHQADWILGTDYFNDIVGGLAVSNGTIKHTNESYFKWQEWEDVVGYCSEKDKRGYGHLRLSSLPVLTSLEESHWFVSDNINDCRLHVRSRAAPRTSVKVDWIIYRSGLFISGIERTFYDVEIIDGTPLAGIRHVSWMDDDLDDPRLWIWSEAQSPFRWFKAKYLVYKTEARKKRVIDDIN